MARFKYFENGKFFKKSARTVTAKEELPIGSLFAIDTDGQAVLATRDHTATGGVKIAVGVVQRASTEKFGEAYNYNGKDVLEVGSHIETWGMGVLDDVTDAEVPTDTPIGTTVYLDVDGKITLTRPATAGNLIQPVGEVRRSDANFKQVMINLNAFEKTIA